jgi:hypothetical protein
MKDEEIIQRFDKSGAVHDDLIKHINALQKEIARIRKDLWRTIASSVVLILIVLGTSIWYSGHVRSEGDRRWCSLIGGLDNRYQAILKNPPTDPEQARSLREFAFQVHQLRQDLGC